MKMELILYYYILHQHMNDPFFTVGDKEYSELLEIIDVKWGYDLTFKEPIKNNGNPGFSANSVQYEIKRDENRESYVSISVKDSVGNTNTRIIAIPEKNRIIRMEQDSENQNLYNYDYKFFSENCPLNPTETTISFSFGTKDKIWEDYCSNTPDNRKKNYFGDNKIDLVNDPVELYIGDSYVPQGAPYYTKAVNCYSFDGWDIRGTNSGVITITSNLDAPLDKYIPQKITSITNSKPNRNEGFVTVKAEFSEYEKNNDYEYFIGYKSSNMDYYSYSKSKEFTVTTGYVYTVKPFIYKDGKYFCHSNAEEVKVDFTGNAFDNKAPKLSYEPLNLHERNSTTPNSCELYPFTDGNGAGLYKNDGEYIFEYWFVPNPTITSSKINCTEDFLYSYKQNPNKLAIKVEDYPELVYDSFQTVDEYKSGKLYFPLDDLPEFSYTLFVKIQDSSDLNNYSIYSNYVNNTLIRDDDFTFTYDKSKDVFNMQFEKGLSEECRGDLVTINMNILENGKWQKNTVAEMDYYLFNLLQLSQTEYSFTSKTETIKYGSDLYSESTSKFIRVSARSGYYNQDKMKGYFRTKYYYPDFYKLKDTSTPIICKNKGILSLDNGIQVFTDNPVLIHTFYCSTNLGDDDEMWLNHGIETGIVTETSNFTYFNDYIKEISSGKFYKTIIHFADGTQLSTDVKVKK